MKMSLPEAARRLGVSPQRARVMVRDGLLPAEKIAGRWVVDSASLPARKRPGRPMSRRVVWSMLLGFDQRLALGPDEAARLRRRVRRLADEEDPLDLWRSWVASRGPVHHLWAAEPDRLLNDERFSPSGVSDPRAQMASPAFAEGYVADDDLADVVGEHLLVRVAASEANAVVRCAPVRVPRPVPLGVVVADLGEHAGARERRAARELLDEWVRERVGVVSG